MKKIISVCLAVALAASMLCMNIFAAEKATPPHVVGNRGAKGDFTDGAESFNDKEASTDISIKFNGDVSHRYAVDIVFENTTADFGSKFVWDVNSHKYVPSETGTGTADDATIQITPTLTITNHSDNVVYYSTSVEKNGDSTVDGLNINAYFPADGSTNVKGVVASAVVGNEQTATFTALVEVAPTEGSWSKYMNDHTNATRKVATYTVTISKDTIA